jgi:hypothetical protein
MGKKLPEAGLATVPQAMPEICPEKSTTAPQPFGLEFPLTVMSLGQFQTQGGSTRWLKEMCTESTFVATWNGSIEAKVRSVTYA